MTHKKQLITSIVIAAIIAGGIGFYAGMRYGKSQPRERNAQIRNGQPGQDPAPYGTGQGRQFGGIRSNPNGQPGSDFTTGEITGKDDKSITIKTRNGGSKIIFFSDSTTVGKSEQGSASDLNNGQQVMVNGKNNTDGTISAQNIQIRPAE
jgi:hypothetical protein